MYIYIYMYIYPLFTLPPVDVELVIYNILLLLYHIVQIL